MLVVLVMPAYYVDVDVETPSCSERDRCEARNRSLFIRDAQPTFVFTLFLISYVLNDGRNT